MSIALCASMNSITAKTTASIGTGTGTSITRSLKFPESLSIGSLLIASNQPVAFEDRITKATPVGIAKGTVTIKIPAGKMLMLEANDKLFQNPKYLNEITPPAIDGFTMGFIGMRESEEGLCDKAIKYLPRFKDLQLLDLNQSDASDVGVADLKSLKNLRELAINESRINGDCLKELAILPKLTHIKMDRCVLNTANLAYLEKFPSLKSVELRWSDLDGNATKQLAGCTQLEILDLSRNKKIDDKSVNRLSKLKKLQYLNLGETSITDAALKDVQNFHELRCLNISYSTVSNDGLQYLANLKHLSKLDLCRTRVTIEGLKKLQALNLKELTLPRANYDKSERDRLLQIFPSTQFKIVGNEKATDELQHMYAPIPN